MRCGSTYKSDLKDILNDLVPQTQNEVKEFRAKHGSSVVGEVTVDMVRSGKKESRGEGGGEMGREGRESEEREKVSFMPAISLMYCRVKQLSLSVEALHPTLTDMLHLVQPAMCS